MSDKAEERILIVDASEHASESLCAFLADDGYRVLRTPGEARALQTIRAQRPEIVILDVTTPNVDGIELIKSMGEHSPGTIVLVLTTYDSIANAREAVFFGADDYIFKPLRKAEVLKTVRSSLDRFWMAKENEQLKETVALFQMGDTINSGLKKESLYRAIVESALSQTRSSLGALVLYDDEKQRLDVPYCSYISGGNIHFPHDYLSFPAVDFVFDKGRPLLLTSRNEHTLMDDMDHLQHTSDLFPEILPFDKELIIYPMKTSESKVIGFIVISKKSAEPSFTQNDIQLLGLIAGQSSVSVHNAYLVDGLERNYVNTLMSLNAILEAKHPYTKGHTQRVTLYSTTIAQELGLSSDEVQAMRDGAMLHDIGKIGISDAILNKPGSLDDAERDIVRRHPIIGERIIKPIKFLEQTLPIIRHHHERMDGRGWPDGLAGVQIPLLVRICTLADAYDAMVSHRPYRDTMSSEEVRRELIQHCGTQFDEELVEIFLRLLDRGLISASEQSDRPVLLKI